MKILLNISEKLLYYGNDNYYIYCSHIHIYIYIYQYFIFIILIYLIILYQSRYIDKREFNWKCWLIQFINVLWNILLLLVILRYMYILYKFEGKKKSPSITICSQRIIKGKKKIYFWTSSFKSIISYNKWMHSVCISFEILLIYFFNLYKKKIITRSKVLSPFLPQDLLSPSLSRRISFTR